MKPHGHPAHRIPWTEKQTAKAEAQEQTTPEAEERSARLIAELDATYETETKTE